MTMNPAYVWAIAGLLLCLMELLIPTAFVESALGLSAFVVAFVAFLIPSLTLQVVLWLVLSTALLFGFRRLSLGHRRQGSSMDALEAQTLTEIPAGATGRVLYEGNSWQARCADPDEAIAPNQPVAVLRQEGTTLIVLPQYLLP